MSKYVWLLDAGHGGIINNTYQTEGKRSPIWSDGRVLYEGVFNRKVVHILKEFLIQEDIEFIDIVDSNEDISLTERVKRANAIYSEDKRCIYISVHANGGGGTGWEVYTSVGATRSDAIATVFHNKMKEEFPKFRFRADYVDGDPDKESQFYVLKNTDMPAILTENFFMDTLTPDCELLLSKDGATRVAIGHFEAILAIENSEKNY